MKWYQDDKGDISSGRIMTMPVVYLGCGVIVAAIIAMFQRNPDAIAMGGIGLGMIGAGLGGKSIAKHMEGRQ